MVGWLCVAWKGNVSRFVLACKQPGGRPRLTQGGWTVGARPLGLTLIASLSCFGRWGKNKLPQSHRTPRWNANPCLSTSRRALHLGISMCVSSSEHSGPVATIVSQHLKRLPRSRTAFTGPATMKAVPSPISASKAASHARPRIASPPHHLSPLRQPAVDPAVGSAPRAHHLVPAYGRGAIPATHANHRALQHARRSSGSRSCILDAKVAKPTQRAKIGLWLESVDASRRPAPSALPHPPRCPEPKWRPSSIRSMAPGTSQSVRDPGSPRTPLADITPFVLAAESCSSPSFFDTDGAELPRQRRSPCLATDITGAIDLLTADETRRLLLLSAQSNISLATTIRDIAFTRISRRSSAQVDQSYLADTFRFDEHDISSNI